MNRKNVSIADFENFYGELKQDIEFDEYHKNLSQIRLRNLELIDNSMKNLGIKELPFSKKEFKTFLTMTELVEYICDLRFNEKFEEIEKEELWVDKQRKNNERRKSMKLLE